jgi:3-phosphoshikimate 1-carboxyvinyltransferase
MMTSAPFERASQVRVVRCRGLNGEFRLPGDKSISHRSAMISAIGSGNSTLLNYSSAADCQNTISCLISLGARFQVGPESISVEGVGLGAFREPTQALDSGNSGSTMRMLAGVLAGQPFATTIDGDESLRGRPMRRIIEPLEKMGARIDARDRSFAPLTIHGGGIKGIEYTPPVASAQVKSAVLLAGLFADGVTTVVEQTPTRNHTEIMLRECGAALEVDDAGGSARISVTGRRHIRALGEYTVAGDISSAAFFLIAALAVPGSTLRLTHIGVNPSRRALIDVLGSMGGEINVGDIRTVRGEPVADLTATSSGLSGDVRLAGAIIANLIDEIPILAIAATQIDGSFEVREARELRVKESDRIRSIVDNLRLMGVAVEEFEDGFRLEGPQKLRGARLDSFGDHRIAMAFTVAGLIASGETLISGAEAAAVSLPEFFDLLRESGAEIDKL